MGSGELRRPPSPQPRHQHPGAEERERVPDDELLVGDAVHDPHGRRRQRRSHLQRSSARHRPQHRTR